MSADADFPIIGVGASAGGIEALEGLFRGLPADPGLALVIVTHLSPSRESMLNTIIARYTDLPVHIATDDMLVEVNQVYVMPADTILEIANRRLQSKPSHGRRERKPIDLFLSALAMDVGELSGGIILSGSDSDGALGLKAIKERGGVTFAQIANGYGPEHPAMPEAAIAIRQVDFAVPVEEIGAKLVEFARGSAILDGIAASDDAGPIDPSGSAAVAEIYVILRNQVGHDFSGYKAKTFTRRVQRRMQVAQVTTVTAYVERLRQDAQEVSALFRDLLINVTSFFRDEDAFETLATTVIPELFAGRGAEETVRIWVPGCATGEEVFSIAILIREHTGTLTAVPRIQIFATDIDERALTIARAARYPAALMDGVSADRRDRFFIADGSAYIVSQEVRELCIFSPHSVIRDPPFSRIDLISCRNLLIYFGIDLQTQAIPTFHYALRPDGVLFLGSAENVTQFDDLFSPLDKQHKVFRRRSAVSPTLRLPILLQGLRAGRAADLMPRRSSLAGAALRAAVDEQVIERFSPPHVVVNGEGDTVYYSTRTGKYLEPPAGAPTRQLVTMARKGLRLDLRTLLREAVETGRSATRSGISVESDEGRVQVIDLTIEPLGDRGGGEQLYLVLFADQGPPLTREEAISHATVLQHGFAEQIERELRETRDRLQSTIEEYETALEELKSSNEELVSVNEEMQSTNEELEASKEELQSVNEELHTVNLELSGKIEALDRVNSDLQNLFESTDVATIFLDPKMVIRSFTPPVAKIFSILPSDRGRPITDLSSRLDMTGFSADIFRVFTDGHGLERRGNSSDLQSHYLIRLAPYRNGNNKIEGVIASFIDVTTLTRAEARQRLLIAELQHRTRNLLAIVQSIAYQTLGKGASLEDFSARLAALSRVQGLIGGAMDDPINLGDIIEMELQAVSAPDQRLTVSGPRVSLGFELVQTFALALHELATNAVKYGALRVETGRLNISWYVDCDDAAAPRLVLDWRETGVFNLRPPTRRGFGRTLIEGALKYTLKADAELSFREDGVSCRIKLRLPASNAVETGP